MPTIHETDDFIIDAPKKSDPFKLVISNIQFFIESISKSFNSKPETISKIFKKTGTKKYHHKPLLKIMFKAFPYDENPNPICFEGDDIKIKFRKVF